MHLATVTTVLYFCFVIYLFNEFDVILAIIRLYSVYIQEQLMSSIARILKLFILYFLYNLSNI